MTRSISILALAALMLAAAPAVALDSGTNNAAPAEAGDGTTASQQAAPAEPTTMTVTVTLKHGADDHPIANTPVFLRAARPRGPFEPTAPKPESEWTGFADANGVATFSSIPRDLTTSGLRLHAVTTYEGLAFESSAITPVDGSKLEITVWDKGLDPSVVEIQNLRTVVEVWENYLVFTQYYTLTNTGKTALDVKLLPGEKYEKGLPFELPVKAKGINVTGPGESMVVNSTFYWKGVLEPNARANLQVRFSMSIRDPEFEYEQQVDWPTQNVEVVVPIQTKFEKLPRLTELELRPPGFKETDRGPGIFDLRDDIDFVGARGLKLSPGESFSFQLRGLPFHRPKLPWLFVALGLVCAVLVVVFARREFKAAATRAGREEVRVVLEAQRAALLDELVAVERDMDEGILTRAEAEFESAALREELALVLKKLTDLEPT